MAVARSHLFLVESCPKVRNAIASRASGEALGKGGGHGVKPRSASVPLPNVSNSLTVSYFSSGHAGNTPCRTVGIPVIAAVNLPGRPAAGGVPPDETETGTPSWANRDNWGCDNLIRERWWLYP